MALTLPIRTPVDVEAARLAATSQAQRGRPLPGAVARLAARREVQRIMGQRLVAAAVQAWRAA